MSWAVVIVGGATLIAGYDQANNAQHQAQVAADAQSAANDAALAQNQAQFEASQALQQQIAEMQIAAQEAIANRSMDIAQEQFRIVRETLAPFITAGNQALGPLQQYQQAGVDALAGQRNLIGLNGGAAQSAAIQGLQNSPEMAAYLQSGEAAMLANASATGGLRGGNVQAAMAQYRPQLLAGLISQQYDRLGGLSSLGANTSSMLYQTGQNASAGVGSASMQVAGQAGSALAGYAQGVGNAYGGLANASAANSANMANAYQNYYNNQGAIAAGNAIAQGQAGANFTNTVTNVLGSYAALQAFKGNGGNNTTMALSNLSGPNGSVGATYSFN